MKQSVLETYLAQHARDYIFVEPQDLAKDQNEHTILIDVREAHEYDALRIDGAINIPRGRLEMDIERLVGVAPVNVVLICKADRRAQLAAITLRELGYASLKVLRGGMDAWVRFGAPTVGGGGLSSDEHVRYARHLSLPDFYSNDQVMLKSKRVLIVGCGGLGSPAIAYLAAAGVGTMRLADADRVDLSNLQRQVIHTSDGVGELKTDSARRFVNGLNPNISVESHAERITHGNVGALLSAVDLVIDGSDNVSTRYCLNDACFERSIPYVYGAVFRDEGECALFDFSRGGPCYRCLHPKPLPVSLSPSCAVAGVIGVVPGVIGILQANLALQYFLGKASAPDVHLSRLRLDQLTLTQFTVRQNSGCETCGQ